MPEIKIIFHDLTKNPNDLPKDGRSHWIILYHKKSKTPSVFYGPMAYNSDLKCWDYSLYKDQMLMHIYTKSHKKRMKQSAIDIRFAHINTQEVIGWVEVIINE